MCNSTPCVHVVMDVQKRERERYIYIYIKRANRALCFMCGSYFSSKEPYQPCVVVVGTDVYFYKYIYIYIHIYICIYIYIPVYIYIMTLSLMSK